MGRTMSYPLFGCLDDPRVCVITYFCPCVTAGKVAEKTGREGAVHCALFVLVPPVSDVLRCLVRGDIRQSDGCEDRLVDLCVHVWLWPCALCQEARETGALDLDELVDVETIERV